VLEGQQCLQTPTGATTLQKGGLLVLRIERKHAPRVGTAGARGLHRRAARVLGYDSCPEPKTLQVSLRHADNPTTDKSIPEKERCLPAHPRVTMPTQDEELGDIEIIGIVGCRGTTRDQRKAGEPGSVTNEKGKPVFGLRPIEGEFFVG